MKKFVVVGGGTAGWLTALYVQKNIPYSNVTVVASSEIGVLGAGEGTTKNFSEFLENDLGLDFNEVIKKCKITIKNAIKFTNWNGDGTSYFHSAISSTEDISIAAAKENKVLFDYNNQRIRHNGILTEDSVHFNAMIMADYLKGFAIQRGIEYIDAQVTEIIPNDKNDISELVLSNNQKIKLDFVFDCSGFKKLIIGNFYKATWHSYADFLPVNRAMPFFLPHDNENIPSYTESIGMKHGWAWKIPVQDRFGCGYVFDSNLATDEEIKKELEEYFGVEVIPPKIFNFNAGCYEKTWINNCIAIGLSSGFAEPLEATAIGISIMSLRMLQAKINGMGRHKHQQSIDEYNNAVRQLNEENSCFVHLHYMTKRTDTVFWRNFKNKNTIPDLVKNVIEFGEKLTEKDLDYLIRIMPTNTVTDYLRPLDFKDWKYVMAGIGIIKPLQVKNLDTSHLQDHADFIRKKVES